MMRRQWVISCLAATWLWGCNGDPDGPSGDSRGQPLPVPTAAEEDPGRRTIAQLRRELGIGEAGEFTKIGGRIRSANLARTDVSDLSPLSGLPLRGIDVSFTDVSDLSPLSGMPLEVLYAESTAIRDVSPLAGMPLETLWLKDTPLSDISPLNGMSFSQLSLVGTGITDLEACRTMPSLGILWVRDTQVSDLSPLSDVPVTSLDVQDTPVADLTPLSGKQDLERLNIAGTPVTDLRPLEGLHLTRLIFTPADIEQGIDVVRTMSSLRELSTQFEVPDDLLTPAEFWAKYDAGEFDPESEAETEASETDTAAEPAGD